MIMLLKCCTQYISKFGKPSSSHRTGKVQFLSQFQRSSVLKNAQTIGQLCSLPMLVKLCSKSFKLASAVLESRTSDVQPWFRKGRGTRDQIANVRWIIEKAKEFQTKTSTSVSLTGQKPLIVQITTNCGKLLKRWESQTILPISSEVSMQVNKKQLEPYMKQLTGSKLRKEYNRALYCQHCLFNLSYVEYII